MRGLTDFLNKSNSFVKNAILFIAVVAFGFSFSSAIAQPNNTAAVPSEKELGQVVNIGGENFTFLQISQMNKEQKHDILDNKLTPEQVQAYQDWRDGMKQAANQDADRLKKELQAANQRLDRLNEASNQMKALGRVLDYLEQNQGVKVDTPELRAKNKERGQILLNALANPIIQSKFQPQTRKGLQTIGETLVRTGSIDSMNKALVDAVKTPLK